MIKETSVTQWIDYSKISYFEFMPEHKRIELIVDGVQLVMDRADYTDECMQEMVKKIKDKLGIK